MLPGFIVEAINAMRSTGARIVYSDADVFGVQETLWRGSIWACHLMKIGASLSEQLRRASQYTALISRSFAIVRPRVGFIIPLFSEISHIICTSL